VEYDIYIAIFRSYSFEDAAELAAVAGRRTPGTGVRVRLGQILQFLAVELGKVFWAE